MNLRALQFLFGCFVPYSGGQRARSGRSIPEPVGNGLLLAEEIAAMDLSGAELAVLSACGTGLGEMASEGVFGPQGAFKKAGVQLGALSLFEQ